MAIDGTELQASVALKKTKVWKYNKMFLISHLLQLLACKAPVCKI